MISRLPNHPIQLLMSFLRKYFNLLLSSTINQYVILGSLLPKRNRLAQLASLFKLCPLTNPIRIIVLNKIKGIGKAQIKTRVTSLKITPIPAHNRATPPILRPYRQSTFIFSLFAHPQPQTSLLNFATML